MKGKRLSGFDCKLSAFARTVVAAFSIFFCGILAMASLLGTTGMEIVSEGEGRDTVVQRIREQLESVVFYQDNVLLNVGGSLVLTAVFLLILHGVSRLKCSRNKSFFLLEILFLFIWTAVIGCVWVHSANIAPSEDSWVVSQTAWDFSKGDYHEITGEDRYFRNYSFQLGFVLFEEILIRIVSVFCTLENLMVIQYISVFMLASAYVALLLLADCIFEDKRVRHVMVLLLALCVQPMLLCTFMYGLIPGFSFSAWAVYFEVRFIKAKGWKSGLLWGILSAIAITMAVIIKQNNLIILTAMVLLALVTAFRSKRQIVCNLALAILCVIPCVFTPKAIVASYEKRANTDLGESIPMISWFVMGFQEAENAPGWYNYGATLANFEAAEFDSDKATESSKKELLKRINDFSSDKQYRNDFFFKKFTSVWNETSYQSIWNNIVRAQYAEKTELSEWVCGDGEHIVKQYMDLMAQFVFMCVLVSTAVCWKRKNTLAMVMPLIMLGGMLYHLLAEAKSQYALPYYIYMTAFAACGFVWLSDKITERLRHTALYEKYQSRRQPVQDAAILAAEEPADVCTAVSENSESEMLKESEPALEESESTLEENSALAKEKSKEE